MFVRIFSEPQNILLPYLVWLCSIMSQSVMQKNQFTVFNVKVTVRAYITKLWLFLLYFLNCWSVYNQTWFDSTAIKARVSCGKNWTLHSRSRSDRRVNMSVNVCPDDIFCTTEHFATKLGMFMQYHEPECHAEKLVHCLQCQGHSKCLYNQNMTISLVSSNVCLVCNQTWFGSTT